MIYRLVSRKPDIVKAPPQSFPSVWAAEQFAQREYGSCRQWFIVEPVPVVEIGQGEYARQWPEVVR